MVDKAMSALLAVTCVVVIAGGLTYLSKNVPPIPQTIVSLK